MTPDHGHARTLAGYLAFELAATRVRAGRLGADRHLARDLDLAVLFATALAAGHCRAAGPSGHALDQVRDCGRAEYLAYRVEQARLRACDLIGPSGRELASDLDRASARAQALASVHGAAIDAAAYRRHVDTGLVSPWADRLVTAAARLLPAGDRDRYLAEYRSELCALAGADLIGRKQIGYAARQLLRAVSVRAAVARA